MSLRTRLIIAFLLLSVVPLTAVTLLSYTASVRAFENAAHKEAAESAADVGRRMEMITADLGRRVDRLFVAGSGSDGESSEPARAARVRRDPTLFDPQRVMESVAPLLGDSAALIDRVEFHPAQPLPPPTATGGHPPAPSAERRGIPAPSTVVSGRPAPPPPGAPAAPPVPPNARVVTIPPPPGEPGAHPAVPPQVIVMDIPKIVEQATRAAMRIGLEAAKSGEAGADVAARIEKDIEKRLAANEAQLQAMAERLSREARPRIAEAARPQMEIEGRKLEVAVHKDGRLLGTANATLNMNRTMHTVLALARRDQGEIPFALDRRGGLYTPNEADKPRLQSLGVETTAASQGGPRRTGDWIVVARQAPSGITFGIARPIGESLREIRRASVRNLSLGLLVVALAFVGIIPISNRMTRHLSTLTSGVRQLAGGDFATRVPVRSSDEFGALAQAFNQMAADLEQHEAVAVEQERLRRELELSRLIQTEMLPRTALVSGPAEIAGISIPAREVGGDFFNYFVLPDGRLALLVGDVSGKGVSAALLMANVQATLRARMPHEMDLARLADALDREMDENTPGAVYLTLFLGILEKDGRALRYVNAGHNPQFVLRAAGGIEPLSSTGMPIALYAGHGYEEAGVTLAPGDMLFFYTDGLVETENETGEMFTAERLQAILDAEHTHAVDTVLRRVEEAITSFRGSAEPFDDATMMALRIGF
jgi:serine phosphatase RsbU (regulator of sigma subunit)